MHFTPINSEYGSCSETYAKLLIYGDEDTSISYISQNLNIEPSEAHDKGEVLVNSLGRSREAKTTMWCLSSEGAVLSKDLRHHINWIVDKLNQNELGFRRVCSREGVKSSLNCVWYSENGHGGPALWPEQMKALASLGLECSFDIYFLDSD